MTSLTDYSTVSIILFIVFIVLWIFTNVYSTRRLKYSETAAADALFAFFAWPLFWIFRLFGLVSRKVGRVSRKMVMS